MLGSEASSSGCSSRAARREARRHLHDRAQRRQRPGSIATSAKKVDGGYVISGQKSGWTSARWPDFSPVRRAGTEKKLTIFLVERGSKGLAVGRPITRWGSGRSHLRIAFDECFVPRQPRLSKEEATASSIWETVGRDPHHHRRMALGVSRAALAEARPLRGRAQAVRHAHQPLPGDPVQAGRDGHRAGGGRAPRVSTPRG